MAKRRFITKLPSIHQTETLKKFFGSTVDQVFQPGTSSQISGYIGRKPEYYDASKDFYIPEPTAARIANQLEPAMVMADSNGSVASVSFFDELINYLRSERADTSDHNRLFGDEFYGWAPPIDLDKIQNFRRYYWFGDDIKQIPAITLVAPRIVYASVDGRTKVFALPPALSGIPEGHETPMVYVNGALVAFTASDAAVTLKDTPAEGSSVTVFRYGDLTALLNGLDGFNPRLLNASSPVTSLITGMRVKLEDGITIMEGFDLVAFEKIFLDNPALCRTTQDVPWDAGSRPNVLIWNGDGLTTIGDGNLNPQYVTIARGARNRNPWSLNNYWFHEDSISWSNTSYAHRRAQRPIVEFFADLELHNYGRTRSANITGTLTGDPLLVAQPVPEIDGERPLSDWSLDPFSTQPLETSGARPVSIAACNGKRVGQVFVDRGHMLNVGDRILILDNANPALKNGIITVKGGYNTQTIHDRDGSTREERVAVMILTIEEGRQGDIVALPGGRLVPWDEKAGVDQFYLENNGIDQLGWEYTNDTLEFTFNNDEWKPAQPYNPNYDPRFVLYTADRRSHAEIVPSFTGNRLFGYKINPAADAKRDAVLGRALVHDEKGQIVFSNDQHTVRTAPALTGFQFARLIGATPDQDVYLNGWYATGERSFQALTEGGFETPLNLFGNPDNAGVSEITRGQWFDNFKAIIERQAAFVGNPYQNDGWIGAAHTYGVGFEGAPWKPKTAYALGATVAHEGRFYRSTVAHTSGTAFDASQWSVRPIHKIVQNRSPLLKTMLLANDKRFDYLDACRFVDQEYTRFRNKFVQQTLEVLRTGERLAEDSDAQWLSTVLTKLIQAKTPDFPFALSTMGGQQFYIPPTAAAMGLLGPVEPGVEVDNTYHPPVTFLRGHDGSRTPISGQFQDRILLALERMIYASIPAAFKTEARPAFDFYDFMASRARDAGGPDALTVGEANPCAQIDETLRTGRLTYTHAEIVQMYTPIFLRWAQVNGLDYRSNASYDESNPFTWNFNGLTDRDGVKMPGSFRAIYRYYFDTDRPHQVPWEMLGFAAKPAWWDAEYGPAPYTDGNLPLWEDLRDGRIRRGPRAGIDARFVRSDLLSVLPVDDRGNLLDPIQARIVPVAPTPYEAKRPWLIGDDGPVENLWKQSVSYPFARSQIGYLMRPAQWIEMQWDTQNNARLPDGQWYSLRGNDRPTCASVLVHGEIDPATGLPRIVHGVQQWIVDHMRATAQDPALLGASVRALQVRLAHKMAGFTQAENLRVFADNFGILPEEDITVAMVESPPLREATYSGVLIEWTGQGYAVIGYDVTKEGFCILPGDPGSPTRTLSIGSNPDVYEWNPKIFYQTGVLVDYRGTTYRCVRSHTSAAKFEDEFWNPQPSNQLRSPKVRVYEGTTGVYTYVPYATVFPTIQAVAEFLFDYGRALQASGFVFDYVDPPTGEIQNWDTMIKQFMGWAQMDWQPGAFITVSPGSSQLKFIAKHGTVYSVEETSNGIYGLLDRTGRPLPRSATFVSRLDEETKIITLSDDLFAARMRVGEIEHAIVFSNRTIFNDVIYDPLLSLRQPRLRLLGVRTADWTGRRDAPGFMVTADRAMPNFWRAAENLRTMFDIERSEDKVLRDYARHVIGYQTRPYLNNLLVSETEQFEFYQGMIQAKGSPGAFQRLTRSRLIDDQTELKFQEEWAVRTGTYGANDTRRNVAYRLLRSDMRANPQLVQFGIDDPYDSVLGLLASSDRWIEKPSDLARVFPPTTPDPIFTGITSPTIQQEADTLPNAGPVRTNEINYACFYPTLLDQLYTDSTVNDPDAFYPGQRIWIYDTETATRSWDVRKSMIVGNDRTRLINIETAAEDPSLIGGYVRIYFSNAHGLRQDRDVGEYIVIPALTGSTPDMRGVHRIEMIEGPDTLRVLFAADEGTDLYYRAQPPCFILRTQRYATIAERNAKVAVFGVEVGDLAYVDRVNGYRGWVVYQWSGTAWTLLREQPRKIDSRRVGTALLYALNTQIDASAIRPEPLLSDRISVIDPMMGLISGEADADLDFKTSHDPAVYFGFATWGREQLGKLWWNLDSVFFSNSETDIIDYANPDRYYAEINYRRLNWGTMCAGSSIDVYEWTRSTTLPVFNDADVPRLSIERYIPIDEFDSETGKLVTAYYYWKRNPTTIPTGSHRTRSAKEVSLLIGDIKNQNLPWMAPILENGMLVGNVDQYTTDYDSVLQMTIYDEGLGAEGVIHNQFALVRKGDETSQPPARVWTNMRNSLTQFDDFLAQVPQGDLLASRRSGNTIRDRRTHTDATRDGVLDARRTFIDTLNIMMNRAPMMVERPEMARKLTQESPTFNRLVWQQQSGIDYIDPPPQNTYDFVVESLEERDAILDTHEYRIAQGFDPWATTPFDENHYDFELNISRMPKNRPARILVTNYMADRPSWSIWEGYLPRKAVEKPPAPPPNLPPIAEDDGGAVAPYAILQGESFSITAEFLMRNDSDPDGDPISVVFLGPAPVGRLVGANVRDNTGFGTGPWLYQTDANTPAGPVRIPYQITDDSGNTANAVLTLLIKAANRPPVAVDDGGTTGAFAIAPGATFAVSAALLLGNDSDPDNDAISIVSVGPASAGALTGSGVSNGVGTGAGPWTFRPPVVYTDTPITIPYTIRDPGGLTASATLTVVASASNRPPVAVDDKDFAVEFSQTLAIPFARLLTNDSDPDRDPISVVSVTQPTFGSVVMRGSDVLYTAPDFVPPTDAGEGEDDGGPENMTLTNVNGVFTVCCSADSRVYTIPADQLNSADGGFFTGQITAQPAVGQLQALYRGAQFTLPPCSEINFGSQSTTRVSFDYTVEYFQPDGSTVSRAMSASFEIGRCAITEPAPSENPTQAVFTYTISDGRGGTDTASVTINLTLPQQDIVAVDDHVFYTRTKNDIEDGPILQ